MRPDTPRRGGPTVVLLAAGMGSRFGGMKQLAGVGPSDETLMDYSIYDALRAGFTSAVFVIRPEMEDGFREFAAGRYGSRLDFTTAHQRLDRVPHGIVVPEGRVKPWGTAHAVLSAAEAVTGPFAVVNADDFYGAEAWQAMAEFLADGPEDTAPPLFGLTGYRIGETLSESGGVNRGVLRVGDDGMLASVEEVHDIVRRPAGLRGTVAGRDRMVPDDALVSMNMWGFTPAVFPILERGFRRFHAEGATQRSEYLIPTVIREAITAGEARVRVLDPGSAWFGITYPADTAPVSNALRALVRTGEYPSPLFG